MKRPSIFWTLLKVRIRASFDSFSGANRGGKVKKKDKTLLFALLMVYIYGVFAMMFAGYFGQLAGPLHEAGLDWLYFTLFGMTSFFIMFICSVFATKTQLYDATDNELLLSMPVPPGAILASRMTMLLITNFLFDLMVGIPALIKWDHAAALSGAGLAAFWLLLLALPFFSLAVASLLGWIIALFSNRARNKSLITVLVSVVFLGVYFLFVTRANVYIQRLVTEKDAIAATLGKNMPLYWFGNAVAGPNLPQLVLTLLVLLVPFVLVYVVLSRTFISVATKNRGAAKVKYRAREMHETPVEKALLRRETKRLLASPVYLLNAGLGVGFLYAGAVFLLVDRQKVTSALASMGLDGNVTALYAVFATCLIAAMVLFTAPSVSLEGKTIWIVKSLPLTSRQILAAKLRLHRRATLPAAAVLALVCAYTLGIPAALIPPLVLAPCAFVYLSSALGLIAGLRHANLEWINETQVVKQGLAVLLAMLYAALLVIAPFLLSMIPVLRANAGAFLYVYTLALLLGTYFADRWIMSSGAALFEELG